MFEELFQQFPGLQNAYEMAVQELGFKGTPEDFIRQNSQDFAQNIPGFSAVTRTPVMPLGLGMGATGANPQTMPAAAMPGQMPQPTMPMQPAVDPEILAYQRGLLSGSIPAATPYGYGMATSPYYGYPRNRLSGLLY